MHKNDDIVKVYDDMFNLIGAEKWITVHQKGLLHQVIHLWLYSDDGDGKWLYFVQRSKEREDFPGLFDIPVTGHIDPEETFSHAVITTTGEHLGLKLVPEQIEHIGNIRQKIDTDTYHDNAFCQVYIKRIVPPVPDFKLQNVEMLFKVKYVDFCSWMGDTTKTITLYTTHNEAFKESNSSDWWWLRKEEFLTIVKPYIDQH